MKKTLITLFLVIVLPLIAYFIMNKTNMTSLGSVDAKNAKPQIIKFTSTMCLDCQIMNKIIREIYPNFQDKIELTEINVQEQNKENQKWIKKYKVILVPTIILKDSSGNQVKRIEGAISKEQFVQYLEDLN